MVDQTTELKLCGKVMVIKTWSFLVSKERIGESPDLKELSNSLIMAMYVPTC